MKNMTRRGFLKVAGAGAAVAGLGLAGCGGSGSAATTAAASGAAEGGDITGKTVAFIPKVTGNAFFESANDGAQKYAKDWGITVDYIGDSTASASAQVAVINQAVANGVDALCISTVDAAGVSDALKKATDAGIVVTTWDSDAQVEDRTLMVSQGTPEILGQMLVDMSVDGLKERGKDPSADEITYVWHYSQATVTDQNSWQVAAEAIIQKDYPNWKKVADNYYSNQDAELAITTGEALPRSPSRATASTAPSTTGASGIAPSRAPWAATSLPTSPLATPSRSATPSPSRASVTSPSRPTTPSPRALRRSTRTTASCSCPSASSSPRTT